MDNTGYVVAGYLLTAGSLAVYLATLRVRGRRARARAEAIARRTRASS